MKTLDKKYLCSLELKTIKKEADRLAKEIENSKTKIQEIKDSIKKALKK